jgi:hypothetical protein
MNKILVLLICVVTIVGCSSAQKIRREERDRLVSKSGLLCDFVNEADFKDVDIELNLRMANKCNSAKPFSISGYKRVDTSSGFMFCCATREGATAPAGESVKSSTPPAQPEHAAEVKSKESEPAGKE